ncbi:NUMOD4 domain-containing protein [Ruminiclostridium josui]|uniref:NUMOD4 domain-containing protein n=1 Tax=Ruminiclostridium josui TaxID=1499 RepID=UPI0004673665|nr:NUMOD4 domain-containing protein [Ruminiclostridium josui]
MRCKSGKIPEYWVMVPGSVKYQVSNYGNFRRILKSGKTKHIKTYRKHDKWNAVKVDFQGKYGEYVVHAIVAVAFLEKPEPELVLWHKNGLRFDDYAGNLEWITRQELGRRTGGKNNNCIPVLKIDRKSGEIIDFYKSIREAARNNYISAESICEVIRGNQKTAAGFRWKRELLDDAI